MGAWPVFATRPRPVRTATLSWRLFFTWFAGVGFFLGCIKYHPDLFQLFATPIKISNTTGSTWPMLGFRRAGWLRIRLIIAACHRDNF